LSYLAVDAGVAAILVGDIVEPETAAEPSGRNRSINKHRLMRIFSIKI
jgi:hypothetical protein